MMVWNSSQHVAAGSVVIPRCPATCRECLVFLQNAIDNKQPEGVSTYNRTMAKDVRERIFTTISGVPVDEVYTPESIADLDYTRDLGDAGNPPYTRGIHNTMYRGKLWTMRQFSGFGTAEET